MTTTAPNGSFRAKLRNGDQLQGTFVKLPGPQVIEIIARGGIDFVILDAEHAPFDRQQLDHSIFSARALELPVLVRVPSHHSDLISSVLDSGASGIVAPHISTKKSAEELIARCSYAGGERGYAGSVRAAEYGPKDMGRFVEEADNSISIIAQIEDRTALDNLDSLLTINRLDALFVGRADLAVSMCEPSTSAENVQSAVRTVCGKAQRSDRSLAAFVASPQEAEHLCALGCTCMVWGSDLGMIKAQVSRIKEMAQLRG